MTMSTSTACLPTAVSSPTISLPSSLSNTSPSTTNSSILSSANSVLSSSPVTPPVLNKTRKHAEDPEGAEQISKRRRRKGRPKIAWTPTRSRKLTRLYLMTNLEVDEIAKVLQADDFKPCKRNIQMQLELMLQPRPNQLRGGPVISQARHNVLRDCRALHKARRAAKHSNAQHETARPPNIGQKDTLQVWNQSLSAPVLNPESRWTSGDSHRGSSPEVLTQLQSEYKAYFARFPFKETQIVNPKDLHDFGVDIRAQDSVQLEECSMLDRFPLVPSRQDITPNVYDELPEIRIDGTQDEEWIIPYCRIPDAYSGEWLSDLSIWPTPFRSRPGPEVLQPNLDSYRSNHLNFELVPPATESGSLSVNESPQTEMLFRDKPPNGSDHFSQRRPSQWSLSIDNHTQLSMDDITSLMENHTISSRTSVGISEISSQKSSRCLSMRSDITITVSSVKQQPLSLSEGGPPVALPGAFPRLCWAQIAQNSLGLCRQDGMLCEHACMVSRFFTSRFGLQGIIYRRQESHDINEVDLFGNSILHVAASLGAPVQYLIELIKQGANIHTKNQAGETFLHLLHVPTEGDIEGDHYCTILDELKIRNFDFSGRDDHGQTCLHILTRPWHSQQHLVKVITKLDSLGWPSLEYRDNLGHSLGEQRKHPFTQISSFDAAKDHILHQPLDPNFQSPGFKPHQAVDLTSEIPGLVSRQSNHERSVKSILEIKQHIHCPTDQAFVDNLANLQKYRYHTDLLKTIYKAGESPWFEDSDGNNGLHCLAEVAFYVPASGNSKNKNDFSAMGEDGDSGSKREAYLDGLLAAGVDPNNYNKNGITPTMAFITHTHSTEGDETMTRILAKLIKAKASIHRRNRQGESALHLAVKFGCRAATDFLLINGANVHARNKNGEGVLEIGHRALKACRKTSGDVILYAQILLCMSLAMYSGAVSTPNILAEWGSVPKNQKFVDKHSARLSLDYKKRVDVSMPGWI